MFCIHAHQLPRVESYFDARIVFARCPEFKNDAPWRALRSKRDTAKKVGMRDGVVTFRYHRTDLVTWYDADYFVVEMYDSRSSYEFIQRFIPRSVRLVTSNGLGFLLDEKGMYVRPKKGELHVRRVDNVWTIDLADALELKTMVLDRKTAAQVRSVMRPFFDWVTALQKFNAPIPRPTDCMPMGQCYSVLRHYLGEGQIPAAYFPHLAVIAGRHPHLMHDAYVLGGAVNKVPVPLGTLPKRNPYKQLQAWSYV